jgi:DNA-binding protein HU-beta
MNKSDLVQAVSEKAGVNKAAAEKAVNAVLDGISNALSKGDRVSLVGFGTFSVSERSARVCRNPRTGEKINVAATKVPKFKPGKALKDKVA